MRLVRQRRSILTVPFQRRASGASLRDSETMPSSVRRERANRFEEESVVLITEQALHRGMARYHVLDGSP